MLPLVGGLFVLVEALEQTGVIATISALLREAAAAFGGGRGLGGRRHRRRRQQPHQQPAGRH